MTGIFGKGWSRLTRRGAALVCALLVLGLSAGGVEARPQALQFRVTTGDKALHGAITRASRLAEAYGARDAGDAEFVAAARADYRTLLEALYAEGHYGGVVSIRIDGIEAATIDPLRPPRDIRRIEVVVDPGPAFAFGRFEITPTAPDLTDVPRIEPGARARSGAVLRAVSGHVEAWRRAGHAKARVASETYVADHRRARLSGEVRLDPGPEVRFGRLVLHGRSAVRPGRIHKIAGLPQGERFSPERLEEVVWRLRQTGTFASVAVEEAEALGPGNTLDVHLTVVDEKPRRIGFGAELSNFEGLRLSSYWLHRNLLGGAERLRIEGSIDNIGGQTSGVDYRLGARLTRPATFSARTDSFLSARLERLDEPDFRSDTVNLGFGVEHRFSRRLSGELALTWLAADTEDDLGARSFRLLNLPARLTWERRNDLLDPTDGFFLQAQLTPFLGLGGDASGLRAFIDARGYQALDRADRFVFAARLQIGSVMSAGLRETYPDYLFASGGGGTVRGQPYRSLEVDLGGGNSVGGRSFIGTSVELRAKLTDSIGAVAFFDAGYIGPGSFHDGGGAWHSGAGLGLRYATPFGPLRLDVAAPVSGTTGKGLQLYLGIGQAF